MLPKENRLIKKKDFDNVYQKGKSLFTKEIGIKMIGNELAVARFGFVVSLKVSKKAVERNKIKRQLREIIRENLPLIRGKIDCVIIARPDIKALDYKSLRAVLLKGLGAVSALME